MIDYEEYELRKAALTEAKLYVDPLCEKFPPEKYTGQSGPSTLISSSGTYTVSALEQVVNSMITIATWLLKDE